MRWWLAVALVGLVSTGANAAPVYLTCVLNAHVDGDIPINVQLNEEGGSASYTFPQSGRSFTVRAIFAPDKVSFGSFEISRTDLAISRINDDDFDRLAHRPPIDHGRCQIDRQSRVF